MPVEVKSREEFDHLLETASEVRVARRGDEAKVKIRTKKALYTFRMSGEEAEAAVKGIEAPVVEY